MKGFRVLNIFSIVASFILMFALAFCYGGQLLSSHPAFGLSIEPEVFVYQIVPATIFFFIAIILANALGIYGMQQTKERRFAKPTIFWNLIAYAVLLIQTIIIFFYVFSIYSFYFLTILVLSSGVIFLINIIYSVALIIFKHVSVAPFLYNDKSEIVKVVKTELKSIGKTFIATCFYSFAISFPLYLLILKPFRIMRRQSAFEFSYNFKIIVYIFSIALGAIFFVASIIAFVLFMQRKDKTKKGIVFNIIAGIGLFVFTSIFTFASLRESEVTFIILKDGTIFSYTYGQYAYGDYDNSRVIGLPDPYLVLFSSLLLSFVALYSINSASRTQFLDKRLMPIIISLLFLTLSIVACVIALVASYEISIHPPMINVSVCLFTISLIVLITSIVKKCNRNFLITALISSISLTAIDIAYFAMAVGYVNYAIQQQTMYDDDWIVRYGEPNKYSNLNELKKEYDVYLIATVFLTIIAVLLIALLIVFLRKNNKKIEDNFVIEEQAN